MKKIFLLLTLILPFSLNIVAQKSLIDEKYGFKTIKLGSPKSAFQGLSLFQEQGDMKTYSYLPDDNNLYYVFDKKFDIIYLYFDKTNSLISIMLSKVFTGYESFKNALDYSKSTIDKFSSAFGEYDAVDKETFQIGVVWYGKKTSYAVGTLYFGIQKSESALIVSKLQELSSGF
jgi:hypothetical protein